MRRRPPCRDSGADPRSHELAERIAARGRELSAVQRALFADIAEFDRSEAWRGDGAVSMVAWLTERCQVSGMTARVWVRAATQLESLPHLAAALADGTLSLDAVGPLADVATPETDSQLAAASMHWSVKQARELAASHRGATDAAAARRFEHRSLRFNDAKATIWMAFTQDDYAVAKAALIARVSWAGSQSSGNSGSSGSSGSSGQFKGQFESSSSGSSGPDGGANVGEEDPLGYVTFDQRLYDGFMQMCRAAGRSTTGADRETVLKRPQRRNGRNGPGGSDGRNGRTAPTARTAAAPTAPRASIKTPAADGADIAPPWLCTPIWDFLSVRIRVVAPTWPA